TRTILPRGERSPPDSPCSAFRGDDPPRPPPPPGAPPPPHPPPREGLPAPPNPPGPAGAGIQDPQYRVAGVGGQFGARAARARDIDQQVPASGQPLGQLGARHRFVELPVGRELTGVRRGDRAGRMLHGPRLLTRRPSRTGRRRTDPV